MASLTGEGWESKLEDKAPTDKRPRIESDDGGDKSICEAGDDSDKSAGDEGEKSVWEGGDNRKIPVDDDEYYSDEMPDEVYEEYARQVNESECFEVEDFRQYFMYNMVVPVDIDDHYLNLITPFAELGIKQFNKDENANFEFVRLVNLTARLVRGTNFYVTFEAKDADGSQIKTFQALVLSAPGREKDELIFCRLKPPPTKMQGTEHEQAGQGLTCS
ncbi:uncharacterized protein LOC119999941 isoform X3 [Tripterygium wilfordii]|uniref:uncharacterized protein LOC119999941 isoform X3 n=1 Tax=Tripterygium wilfordii TaxID=458696 RepID=UPI0018F8350C|nr:uncharacterized protein LOC119999941 isoform X3 [Tripterygium wilfordii]XP_038703697.1 uncharacterized protein LOC119999941 isoform X3 [Tripterygium wilfordii]